MKPNATNSNHWENCRPGEVGRLVHRLKYRRRQRTVKAGLVAISACTLLLVAGITWYGGQTSQVSRRNFAGGITCRDVLQQATQFVNRELDVATSGKIRLHLEQCPNCRERIERMQQAHDVNAAAERASLSASAVVVNQEPSVGQASESEWLVLARN